MEITLTLDLRPDSGVPLHQQVYEQIRDAVLTGRVRSRQKLPSSRQLAQSLSVSRTTVIQSYDQLISEGYLETRRGSGTFVCTQIPDALLSPAPPLSAHAPNGTALATGYQTLDSKTLDSKTLKSKALGFKDLGQKVPNLTAPRTAPSADATAAAAFRLSTYGQRLFKTAAPPERLPDSLSFRYWRPDLDLFPVKQWQRVVNRCCTENRQWMTYSPEPMGHQPLRDAIATYITQVRAVNCTPEQVLITQGTQQALGLIAQVLLEEGDAIAIEDPGYLSARKVFSAHGALSFPIPVDHDGLQVSALNQLSDQTLPIKLTYVTPSHQFPTGVLMSLPRRLALLDWAQRTGGLIIEDDYDSEFRYSGRPIPALQGLDTCGRVIYVGTFSKVMFPGLRLGYIVLPPALVPVFRRAKWVCDRQGNLLHQTALTQFIRDGLLAKHIRRMRSRYDQRRQLLIDRLQDISKPAGGIEIIGDPAGLHFMARLPLATLAISAPELVKQANKQGVQLFEVAPYYHPKIGRSITKHSTLKNATTESANTPSAKAASLPFQANTAAQPTTDNAFIFGFGGLSEDSIEQAIEKLRPLFARCE